MTDDRNNWEKRLEALDEQLAALGIDPAPSPAASAPTPTPLPTPPVASTPPSPVVSAASEPATVRAPSAAGAASERAVLASSAPSTEALGTATAVDTVDPPPLGVGQVGSDAGAVAEEGSADESDDEDERSASRRRAFVDWVVVIGVALLVAFLVRTFVLAHFVVDGASMSTTLHHDDRVFVNKLSYRLHDPNRGDVVVLHQIEGTSSRDLIKRVIGLPGETVEFRNCVVTIDGRVLEEPYIDPENTVPGQCGRDQAPIVVPPDHVFVMGDNRGQSLDSRSEQVGTVDEDNLVGRAFVVFWPRSSWQWL